MHKYPKSGIKPITRICNTALNTVRKYIALNPGFFVTEIKNLEVTKDSIFFTLDVPNEEILTEKVDLELRTFEGAIAEGYKNWPHKMRLEPELFRIVFTSKES